MEFFVGNISDLIKYLAPSALRHVWYVVRPSSYVEKLRKPMEKLTERRVDVERSVDAARRRGEMIKKEVEAWLERVDRLQTELRQVILLHDAIQENRGCFQGGCSVRVRYRVGKEADKKLIFIVELQNEGQFLVVSDPALLPGIESIPTPDFHLFQSTESSMKEIMKALQDENIKLIGVFGMGGVGKTTLVKELGKGVKRDGLFDQVVMVTVSQHPIVKKIQGEIAENVGMRLEEESEAVRGRRLLQRLKQDERILIILDDMWEPLELANIGIPIGDDSNELCKVVMTTRSQEVCSLMGTQVEIEVSVLTEPDDWNLFHKNAGDCVASTELHMVAREVAKECGGLPIALVTLGRALRNKDPTVWADAACQLKRSNAIDITGMHAKVFNSIKLSYDFLEDDQETQFCFLLCCLFPEDCEIYEGVLLSYVIGERVFKDVESLMEARNRLHTVLDKLHSLCLLLKVGDRHVKMHDVVRDVAIEIARQEDLGFEVKASRGLEQWQDMENLEKCKRLSLMKNEIIKLPHEPHCFQVETLSLRENRRLTKIPDRFFEGMTSLTTLDLSFTSICSLPPSLLCLTNLRVLDIGRDAYTVPKSPPMDVSLLGNLKELVILDLENCGIKNLPKEIGGLTKLKLLNLSVNRGLTIPPNVVLQLSRLEELDMYDSFDRWDIEGSQDRGKAYFSEIASLIGLTYLSLHISNVECVSVCVPNYWKNLIRFSVTVGDIGERLLAGRLPVSSQYDTHMGFFGLVAPEELSDLFKMLLGRTEDMIFQSCDRLKNVLQIVKIYEGFNNLKALKFKKCGDLEYLLNAEVEKAPESAFNSLEFLELYDLEILKDISRGPLPNGYFNKLSSLHVKVCGTLLTNVLNSGLIARLPNLENLHVYNCCGLIEIFNSEGLEPGLAPLMKLRDLKLVELNELGNIWKGVIPYGALQSIVGITVHAMKRLKYLFSPTMAKRLQKLERLDIYWCREMVQIISIDEEGEEQAGVDSIEKCKDITSSHSNLSNLLSIPNFHNLRFLHIYLCPKLKNFLPLNLARGLLQLEEIRIARCNDMEEIFAMNGKTGQIISIDEEGDQEQTWADSIEKCKATTSSHSNLSDLLSNPNFHNLRFLSIYSCPKLKYFLPLNLAGGLLQLVHVEISKCDDMEEIFVAHGETYEGKMTLPKLNTLMLVELPKLLDVVTFSSQGDLLLDLPSLVTLHVEGCPKLKILPLDTRNPPPTKINGDWIGLEELRKKIKGKWSNKAYTA